MSTREPGILLYFEMLNSAGVVENMTYCLSFFFTHQSFIYTTHFVLFCLCVLSYFVILTLVFTQL